MTLSDHENSKRLKKLLDMDWANELTPLVDMLNLGHGSQVGEAVREIGAILKGCYSIRTCNEARRLERFLSTKLATATNSVKIIGLAGGNIRVDLEAEGLVENLWADFICIFLYRDDWRDLLGSCPLCQKWFERSRKNQVYCSEACKSKAAYARSAESRRSARRERYRKDKLVGQRTSL